ncbi:MAG TPA: protein phosphatase 2C domain-containing protein [Roseiflexaceae bacterium]|nr:protein phosphatase 2C domain-containing protein [Roseiflexaceae bacterium]
MKCPSCGVENRDSARFCVQCATPLTALARPRHDDHDWLAATLAIAPSSHPSNGGAAEATTAEDAPKPTDQQGVPPSMDQPTSAAPAPELFAGRYAIEPQQGDRVLALDRQPWRRCWACGATSNEAGEMFCIECGASLEGRRYAGQLLREGAPSGLTLVPEIDDEQVRAVLPEIWDQVRDGEATLTLAADSGRAPIAPPLEELDSLQIGLGLARLLEHLHARGYLLGAIAPEDVELAASGAARLRAAPNLRKGQGEEETAADLRALATLLESLTATPRTTQRLETDQAEALALAVGFPETLRSVRTGEITSAKDLADRLEDLRAERTSPVPLRMLIGSSTHKGMIREIDEDSLLALELRADQNSQGRTWGLFIVADGMGGHSAGEVASGLAIRGAAEVVLRTYLTPTLEMDAPFDQERLEDTVRKACLQANEYVVREARARGNDMGTTITMALVVGDRAVIGNVGDSRTYFYRDGALRRVSKDHSLVMRLVELGQITEDDIYTHPQRSAVLRSLGDKPEIEVDLFTERLRPGDALFLCSDGQWEMTRNPQMAEIIANAADPQAAADALIEAANAAGGEDNITAILVKFEKYGA